MVDKIINCKCCKKLTTIEFKQKKYCDNCSEYIDTITKRVSAGYNNKYKKLREELKEKYKHISMIREPMNNDPAQYKN